MKQQNHFEIADLDLMCLKMTLLALGLKQLRFLKTSQFESLNSK